MADRLFESIISYMESRRQCSTAELAKVAGLREARDVMSTLHELERRGKIQQVPRTPYWERTHFDRMRGLSPRGRQGRAGGQAQDYRSPRQSGRGGGPGGNVAQHKHTGGSTTGDLKDKLLRALRAKNGMPVTALELAKQLGFPSRKHVNPALYALHKEGVIHMSQDSGPPVWSVGNTPPPASTPQGLDTGASFGGPSTHEAHYPPSSSEEELARRLMNVLASSREPQTALQLGQAVGASRNAVTPILRGMGTKGVIAALPGNPERWSAKTRLGTTPGKPQPSPQQLERNPRGVVTSHGVPTPPSDDIPGRREESSPLSSEVQLPGQVMTVSEQMESMSEQITSTLKQIRSTAEQMESAPEQMESAPERMESAPERMESAPEQWGTAPEQWGTAPEQWGTAPERMHSATNTTTPVQDRVLESPGPTSSELASMTSGSSSSEDDTSGQLVALLRTSPQLTALQLAQKMGVKRADINPVLYKMEKQGVVMSVSGSMPPRWSLVAHPASSSSLATGTQSIEPPATQSGEADLQLESFEVDMEEEDAGGKASLFAGLLASLPPEDVGGRLLLILRSDVTMQYTELELARYLDLASRHDVAPHLKALESEGLVCRTSGSFPVKWGLVATPTRTPPSYPPSAYSSDSDVRSATSTMFVPSVGSLEVVSERIAEDVTRNPVSWLTEYCQAKKFELVFAELREYGPPHRRNFVVAAQFAGHSFEAESTNKKEARRMAADLALQTVLANQVPCSLPPPTGTSTEAFEGASVHDRIARLSHEFYLQVQNSLRSPQPGRKVTACFVMEDASSGRHSPVAVGSGTRCITGDHMSLEGLVVNDSHAEIVARRSLLRFFYGQLRSYHQGSRDTVFRECPDHPPLVEVKEDIRFHLYISTAPCGDGAQFSRGDDQNREPPPPTASTPDEGEGGGEEHRPTMSAKTQGVLRTKMEGGEGTIPVGADAPGQTWDGILHGGRLRTMSCSDKVGRWNVVGLQGALLAHFMRPAYLSSLTLGSLHHHGHLSRAVCCRFSDLSGLPDGFAVHHPRLGRVRGGDEMKRHTEKACNFSLNWAHGDEEGELIDGGNGRPVPIPGGPPRAQLSIRCSRISKASLLGEFVALCEVTKRTDLFEGRSYREIKEAAAGFQRAKGALYKLCEQKGYGTWMKKPPEQEHFDATILERLKRNDL